MSGRSLLKLSEPRLQFGHDQSLEDPRDGLTLFGPLDEGKTFGIRPAVIGTADGLQRFWKWAGQIQHSINDKKASRPPFPGFEAAFGVPFSLTPVFQITVDAKELMDACHLEDRHQRAHRAVHLYADCIKTTIQDEEARADVWFVIVPDEVYRCCRPKSVVEKNVQLTSAASMSRGFASRLISMPSMFPELNKDAIAYRFQPHFHNQLKAVLLDTETPTQVIRESTLTPSDFLNAFGRPIRAVGSPSEIAWNLSTTAFYKAGARPWKIAEIRGGVCYLGLVFKLEETGPDGRWSSCGAQMFLDSGDGLVFKGTGGPWYSEETNSYHLDRRAAKMLIKKAVESYGSRVGEAPTELFVHGKARFSDDEWKGFCDAIPHATKLVGVRIREAEDLRVYRIGRHAPLRGLAYVRDGRTAFLWASGFIPRLQTYPGREVPKPLLVDVCRGRADIETVLKDVLALTKLNYNACIYGDGEPVTLKFADAVGEILTAGPVEVAPLPFKHYI